MYEAKEAVRGKKMRYLKVSKEFQVLDLLSVRKKSVVAASTTLGRKPVFPKEVEEELQQHLVDMEAMFYELTKRDIYQLTVRYHISLPFKGETAGKDWCYAFTKRKPKLAIGALCCF